MVVKEAYEKLLDRLGKLPPIENMSEQDRKDYSEIGKALLRNELELLIEEKRWVLGVITSGSMLDFVGKIRLIWKYKGSISKNKILNFNFATTITCLFTSGIIDEKTYKKMEKIRNTRNKFAHKLLRLFSISNKPNPSLEHLIEEAIETIETLF